MDDKNKKKTLTISTDLKKKIDITSINKDGKKSFSIEKKKPFRSTRESGKLNSNFSKPSNSQDPKKKNICKKICRAASYKSFYQKRGKTSWKK